MNAISPRNPIVERMLSEESAAAHQRAPFAIRNLSILAYAQGFTLWHYRGVDSCEEMSRPGYFDGASDMLAAGDMLMMSSPVGGRIVVVAKDDQAIGVVPLS